MMNTDKFVYRDSGLEIQLYIVKDNSRYIRYKYKINVWKTSCIIPLKFSFDMNSVSKLFTVYLLVDHYDPTSGSIPYYKFNSVSSAYGQL